MAQIFISYRRSDSQANTDRIYAGLVKAFGRKSIFKDVDDIPPGVDFPNYLQNKVRDAKIVLIVIGKQWTTAAYEDGSLRLHDPEDFVRIEVELALSMGNALVIPVLVNNAPMPSPNQLPESIRSITRLNAMQVRNDPDFENDSKRLVRKLKENGLGNTSNLTPLVGIGLAIIVMIAVIFANNLFNQTQTTSTPTSEATTEVALVATTIAPSTSEVTQTPTLAGFQLVQTAEAGITQAHETQVAFNETVTQDIALSVNATATAQQFGITETSAYATLFALSATPTITSSPTEQATATNTNLPLTPTDSPSSTPDTLEEVLRLASTPMSNNAQWEALYPDGFVWEFDGVPMVLVPAGCFRMGNDPGAYYTYGNGAVTGVPDSGEKCFQPFWIDLTEVTQEQFTRLGGIRSYPNEFIGDNRPVETISIDEAVRFCDEIREGYLPEEDKWEYAARGVDNLVYPWGNDFVGDNVVYANNSNQETAIVGSRTGASWVGALDMAGNVREWTNTYFDSPASGRPDGYITRGGSFTNIEPQWLRSAARNWSSQYGGTNELGFRCARSFAR